MQPQPSAQRGPAEGGEHPGIDAPEDRPGVPMEAEPEGPAEGAHWQRPERQQGVDQHLIRAGLDRPTAVVGTAQQPRGISGGIRRAAYQIPEHYARHWALLLLADRVDVVEDRLGAAMAGPMEQVGLVNGARVVRRNPAAVVAGAVAGVWLVRKLI